MSDVNPATPPTPPTPEAWRKARLKFLLLGAFFVLPFAAATVAWWFELVPGTSGNYGTLLAPRPVVLPPAQALKGKWVLVQFDGGACNEACERKLYFMRQVRRAMGREVGRVERLWLLTDDHKPRPEVLAAIEGTVVATAAAIPEAASHFPADRAREDHLYLVDPIGNVMMRFPPNPDPAKVIKDLQRVLRLSRFG